MAVRFGLDPCTACGALHANYYHAKKLYCRACVQSSRGFWWKLEEVPADVPRLFQVRGVSCDGDRFTNWMRAELSETDEQVLARAIELYDDCGGIVVEEEEFEMTEGDANAVVSILLADDLATQGGDRS